MDEPEAPPPHAGKRLTREDVLRLIEEHGGPEGLDLRKADLREADLRDVDLHGANLWKANLQGATLTQANLQEAHLPFADLQRAILSDGNLQGAFLFDANLQGANLSNANLQRAILPFANFQGARLSGASMRRVSLAYANLRDADLEGADWGDYVLGEEIASAFGQAASVYRALKQRNAEAGMYDIAGHFFYREMEARRKVAWQGRRLPYATSMYLLRFLYGYGERPERVIAWAAAIVFGFALVHWLLGTVSGAFLDALYYSAASFTAVGYGGWAPAPQGWAGRFLGVGEALLGVFMMALFLVTFTRKMTR